MSTPSSNFDMTLGTSGVSDAVPTWKHELNERLQANRLRRTRRTAEQPALPAMEHFSGPPVKPQSKAARLAAKVAERYAKAPSYSEVLAAEARAAAAEAALSAAQEAHDAAQALLAGLECQASERMLVPVEERARGMEARERFAENAQIGQPCFDASESLDWDLPRAFAETASGDSLSNSMTDALSAAIVMPVQPLPVNLIEFPRELVATRKARPRLAEGPLRGSYEETAHDQTQLRIFEVEPESISKEVHVTPAAEWASIRLDAKPAANSPADDPFADPPIQAAPLEDRLMAGIFDLALVLIAFVLFVLVFVACTAHPPVGKPAVLAASVVLVGLLLLYQFLFFRFTDGTPGMHYAKIALCNFEDENPTRKAMRKRIPFLLLSAAPLGLGFAWAWFDADRLGWHDRLTRMYQRSYRD